MPLFLCTSLLSFIHNIRDFGAIWGYFTVDKNKSIDRSKERMAIKNHLKPI